MNKAHKKVTTEGKVHTQTGLKLSLVTSVSLVAHILKS